MTREVTAEKLGICDWLITITTTRKTWFGFGQEVTTVERYRGNCTVWHDAETARYQGPIVSDMLYQIWVKANWRDKDKR